MTKQRMQEIETPIVPSKITKEEAEQILGTSEFYPFQNKQDYMQACLRFNHPQHKEAMEINARRSQERKQRDSWKPLSEVEVLGLAYES